jgi:hypothetical protein
MIGGCVADSSRMLPVIGNADVLQLSNLVRTLCLFHDVHAVVSRRSFTLPKTIAEAIEFLLPLEALLQDWPAGFRAHVVQRLDACVGSPRTLNAALGVWYQALKQSCASGALHPFLDNVTSVASERFAGLIGLDAAGTDEAMSRFLPLKAAARRLGISGDRLARSVENGLVQGETRKFGNRRLAIYVQSLEVERIARCRSQWKNHESISARLDVPRSVISSLAACGSLTEDRHWRNDICKGGPISVDSASRLEADLRAFAHANDLDGPKIELRQITSRRIGDKRALSDVFTAISRGEIQCVAPLPEKGIGRCVILETEVRRYFGTPLLESGMSIRALTTTTGWKHESVCHWIDEGLLEAETIALRGQPCRVVTPAQLLRFTRQYVPLADLAKLMSSRPTALARKFHGIELVGAKPLPGGRRRGGLVRLSDLAGRAFAAPSSVAEPVDPS